MNLGERLGILKPRERMTFEEITAPMREKITSPKALPKWDNTASYNLIEKIKGGNKMEFKDKMNMITGTTEGLSVKDKISMFAGNTTKGSSLNVKEKMGMFTMGGTSNIKAEDKIRNFIGTGGGGGPKYSGKKLKGFLGGTTGASMKDVKNKITAFGGINFQNAVRPGVKRAKKSLPGNMDLQNKIRNFGGIGLNSNNMGNKVLQNLSMNTNWSIVGDKEGRKRIKDQNKLKGTFLQRMFGDHDKDGVRNIMDCEPLNRFRDGFLGMGSDPKEQEKYAYVDDPKEGTGMRAVPVNIETTADMGGGDVKVLGRKIKPDGTLERTFGEKASSVGRAIGGGIATGLAKGASAIGRGVESYREGQEKREKAQKEKEDEEYHKDFPYRDPAYQGLSGEQLKGLAKFYGGSPQERKTRKAKLKAEEGKARADYQKYTGKPLYEDNFFGRLDETFDRMDKNRLQSEYGGRGGFGLRQAVGGMGSGQGFMAALGPQGGGQFQNNIRAMTGKGYGSGNLNTTSNVDAQIKLANVLGNVGMAERLTAQAEAVQQQAPAPQPQAPPVQYEPQQMAPEQFQQPTQQFQQATPQQNVQGGVMYLEDVKYIRQQDGRWLNTKTGKIVKYPRGIYTKRLQTQPQQYQQPMGY